MNTDKPHILIVEDDQDSQAMVKHVFQYLHYEVDQAISAEQAEQYILGAKKHYDAVVIDLTLPGKSGVELFQEIRVLPNMKDTVYIAITGYHTLRAQDEMMRVGFNAYFPKPIDATVLAQAIQELI